MAIQQINLGSMPLGAGGDTQRAANEKINQNFSNQAHAASRLVGEAAGNVMEVGAFGIGLASRIIYSSDVGIKSGLIRIHDLNAYGFEASSDQKYGVQFVIINSSGLVRYRTKNYEERFDEWQTVYSTANTTKEKGTGYLVASSPVLKIQHDSFEKVHEAEQLDIDIKHIKTGVYEITGTTGLRENDGWNLKPPKDVNGNVLCICEATEEKGVITLKTYKKKFDFETVSIVADYEQPTDIPEGAVVMLRFNDLPQE